ncbi:MAG: hypothetical protein SCH71_03545 [Desulfobulbaceae bacterium]|nr:hypothetical protein [Desulfobulbaceae bacterium]
MQVTRWFIVFLFVFAFAATAAAGNGYMGGDGDFKDGGGGDNGGGTVEEPGTDTTTGSLYGDLFVIMRYLGGETKNVPEVDANGDPVLVLGDWIDENGMVVTDGQGNPYQVWQQAWTTAPAVGGEPLLTEGFATYTIVDEETGEYVVNPLTGDIYYPAPYPSQCVQPVANFDQWGDISSKTGLPDNLLPIIMTYDATWERTECEVVPDIFIAAGETWNGVTYYTDIYYPDLIQEVSFGRLNLGRSPDAVLDHAFDEAITAINRAKDIALDASGRLLLTTDVYDEFLTNPDGTPVLIETVTKAIDSPLENLALYVKLMKDGHLITPGVERTPIDRSMQGGIPLWKLLELEDGPSQALRPTIDIAHVQSFGLGHLVDASNVTTYYTYRDVEGNLVVQLEPCTGDIVCEEWTGIVDQAETDVCAGPDFPFSASFVSAAADKTGYFNIDKIVYLNSIMGINLVVGYSEYDVNFEPVPGAIDYSENPVYFNFGVNMNPYDRLLTYAGRGQVVTPAGDGLPATYDGNVRVLVEDQALPGTWVETVVPIAATIFGTADYPAGEPFVGTDITGFTAMADDDLRVIEYIHTYQIPGLR